VHVAKIGAGARVSRGEGGGTGREKKKEGIRSRGGRKKFNSGGRGGV